MPPTTQNEQQRQGLSGSANREKGEPSPNTTNHKQNIPLQLPQAQTPPITTRTFHCRCPTRRRVFHRLDNRFRAQVPRGRAGLACRRLSWRVWARVGTRARWRAEGTHLSGAISERLLSTGFGLASQRLWLPNSPSFVQPSRLPRLMGRTNGEVEEVVPANRSPPYISSPVLDRGAISPVG